MIPLTPDQERALKLLLPNSSFFMVSKVTVATSHTESGYDYKEKVFDKSCFVIHKETTYHPAKHLPSREKGYKDSKTSYHTISFKVAGELQNKALARLHMDISNHSIHLQLTEFGKEVASKLEAKP